MNKQYKLTNDSKFCTAMKAAVEYGLNVTVEADKDSLKPVHIYWQEDDGWHSLYAPISETPETIQHIIDKINQKKGENK